MVVGATSGTSAMPCAVARRQHLRGLTVGQVGHDHPARAAARQALDERRPRLGAKTMFA